MTDIIWPVTLPQDFLAQGLKEVPPDNVIRTKTEYGPVRSRRRTTSGWTTVEGTIAVAQEDVAILEDFYEVVTKDGTTPFLWVLPITGRDAMFTFSAPPNYGVRSGEWVNVSLKFQARKI